MDTNFFEIKKAISELKMRAAFFTSISIILVGCVLWYVSGKDALSYFSYLAISTALISVVSVIRYTIVCRNLIYNGYISYWRSVVFATGFYFLSGMIITLGIYLFLYFHPDFFSSFFEELEQAYDDLASMGQEMSISTEELTESKNQILAWSNFSIAVNIWFSYLFYGSLFSFLYSFFIRGSKQKPSDE